MNQRLVILIPILVQGLRLQADLPSLEVYVINLESRPDRCRCMAQQLNNVQFSIQRQPAVPQEQCEKEDALHVHEMVTSGLAGDKNHSAELSLFCSNYQIWKQLHNSNAEFGVIMEDDAILSETFWSTLLEYVSSPYVKDFVTIDPFPGDEWSGAPFQISPGRDFDIYAAKEGYWGTTVTVVKRSFATLMIQKARQSGMAPTDRWWTTEFDTSRTGMMFANIVRQQEYKIRHDGQVSQQCKNIGESGIKTSPMFQRDGDDDHKRLACPSEQD